MFNFSHQTPAALSRHLGYNAYGETSYAPAVAIQVAVITFENVATPSPVRDLESASRARVEQEVARVVLLVDPFLTISVNDRVNVFNTTLRVLSVTPKPDLFGRLDAGHQRVVLDRSE